MIFKLTFPDKTEWATAENILNVLTEYEKEYGDDVNDIKTVETITDKEAKKIKVTCEEEPRKKFSLYDLGGETTDFTIIASTEYN